MSRDEWFIGHVQQEVLGMVPDTSPASERRPTWMYDGMEATLIEGADTLEVAGESFYQDGLWMLVGGRTTGRVRHAVYAILVAEHDNRHDANAVSVWIAGQKVGHLGRADAARLRDGLVALQQRHGQAIALAGQIVGGGTGTGRLGLLGVLLEYDSAEFAAG